MTDKAFDEYVKTLPESHWAKYDLAAVKLGWDAARAFELTERSKEIMKDQRNVGLRAFSYNR